MNVPVRPTPALQDKWHVSITVKMSFNLRTGVMSIKGYNKPRTQKVQQCWLDYSQYSPCGHPAITNTLLLRTSRYYEHPAIMNTPLLRTPRYYGHPAITDTPRPLSRTGAKSPVKTTKKCTDVTPPIADSRYYGIADTLCGPKQTFVLFYSRYNGHLGHIECHVLLFVNEITLKIEDNRHLVGIVWI